MSDLIPQISVSDFKKLKAHEIRELKAVEVYSDNDYLFTAIIPHGDYIAKDYARTQAEYLGVKANIGGGEDPEIILRQMMATPTEKYPNLAKARATRQANLMARKKEEKVAIPV